MTQEHCLNDRCWTTAHQQNTRASPRQAFTHSIAVVRSERRTLTHTSVTVKTVQKEHRQTRPNTLDIPKHFWQDMWPPLFLRGDSVKSASLVLLKNIFYKIRMPKIKGHLKKENKKHLYNALYNEFVLFLNIVGRVGNHGISCNYFILLRVRKMIITQMELLISRLFNTTLQRFGDRFHLFKKILF